MFPVGVVYHGARFLAVSKRSPATVERNPVQRTYSVGQVEKEAREITPEEKEPSALSYLGEASEASFETDLLASRQRGSTSKG